MTFEDVLPNLVLIVLLSLGVVTTFVAVHDVIRWRGMNRPIVGRATAVVCVVLSILALGFLYIPSHAPSTGAECLIRPSTQVLGPQGSEETIRELPDATDRTGTRECNTTARSRIAVSSVVLLSSLITYIVVRRRGPGVAEARVRTSGQG